MGKPIPKDENSDLQDTQVTWEKSPVFVFKHKQKPDPLLDVSLKMLNEAVDKTYQAIQDKKWQIPRAEVVAARDEIIDKAQGILNELVAAQKVQKKAGNKPDPQLQIKLRESAKPYVLTEVMKAAVSGMAQVNGKEQGALGEKAKVGDTIDKGVVLFGVEDIVCVKQSFSYTENFEKEHQNRWRATFTAPGDSIGNVQVASLGRGAEVSGEITNPDVKKREQYEVLKLTKLVSLDSDTKQIKKKQSLPAHESGTKKRGGRSL